MIKSVSAIVQRDRVPLLGSGISVIGRDILTIFVNEKQFGGNRIGKVFVNTHASGEMKTVKWSTPGTDITTRHMRIQLLGVE